ncbi:MAG: 5-formyltetrahydrofolate cyclo-ligase [Magnetococcales bacterium]|nr:5-formyltetrahydrofolate cyclo-ligase [Magnetococcales bacterium]
MNDLARMASMNDLKAALRQHLRDARMQLSSERVATLSSAIVRHLVAARFYQRARTIGLYHPTDNEVDPSSLLHDAECAGKTIFLPIVEKKRHSLRFVPFRSGDPLRVGAYGILEPTTDEQGLDCLQLDLILQPLVGFDGSGCRLGFGGGYYDRALANSGVSGSSATVQVGLAYGFQEVPVLPREPHDRLMEWVVTEHGVRQF